MRIAVLTLTRDRLDYTKHCFARLQSLAGCEYDHYVLDQASEDGTYQWLQEWMAEAIDGLVGRRTILRSPENVGVSCGMNRLLDILYGTYDVVVKFDNDCELLVQDTLKVAAEVAMEGWIISPHIKGLIDPPPVQEEVEVLGHRVGIPPLIGGIFMATPGRVFDTYRHNETNPLWGMDDVNLCSWWRSQGHGFGYLLDFPANHYLTTRGQMEDNPVYYARKDREFAGR